MSCTLSFRGDQQNEKVIPTQTVDLDMQPEIDEDFKSTETRFQKYMTLRGKTGSMFVDLNAIWFREYNNGSMKVNNLKDTFPFIRIQAAFIELLADGTPGDIQFININSRSAPGLNPYGGTKSNFYEIRVNSSLDQRYGLHCIVNP